MKLQIAVPAPAMAVAFATLVTGAAQAQPASVDNVVAVAKPVHYTGPCPGVIQFVGTIFSASPATVSYRWERSDGVTSEPRTVFVSGGSKTVETTWRLGTPTKVVRGSQRLRVLSPGDTYSTEASFAVACGAAANHVPWGLRPGD